MKSKDFIWSAERIRFLEDAVDYLHFSDQIVQQLLPYFTSFKTVCDAGCGTGHLSLALCPFFKQVYAVDRSEAAIDTLSRKAPENLSCICADITQSPPQERYDAMVFSFFGSTEEILKIAKAQCRGTVLILKRYEAQHQFSLSHEKRGLTADDTANYLRRQNVPFSFSYFETEMGQPFRSMDDAVLFFNVYNRNPNSVLCEADIRDLLTPVSHPKFRYYYPQTRKTGLFILQTKNL